MSTPLSEPELARACAAGGRAAQKALYDRYCDDLLLLCLRYIANAEDAREALMDGFYNCFRSIGSFEYAGAGSLKAWLKKIVVNCCLMQLRRRVAPVTELEEGAGAAVADEALARLSAKELLALIQGLPAGYRTVFNLYFFEDHSHREIAQLLGISESTSKSQLAKARASLQQMIAKFR